jgi:pimeloyl-ACP methyl ester carboxylesterase
MTTGRPAAILLHGQPAGPYRFARLVRELGEGWDLVAPSRPGYGANPAPATGFRGNAEAALRELDARGIERAAVVGHSWAGGVALALALDHPDRVSHLVLAASVGPHAVIAIDRFLARPRAGAWTVRTAYRLGGAWATERVRRENWPDLDEAGRREFEALVDATAARGGGWDTFYVEQVALIEELPDLDARLADITVPTTVIHGTRDLIVPRRTARGLAAQIPGATLDWVKGAGHELLTPAAPLIAERLTEHIPAVDRSLGTCLRH